jgi:hypothetical protein
VVRKAPALLDRALDFDYSGPRFEKLGHLKELHYTDKPDPRQDNLYTNDHGRYVRAGNGPAKFHTSPDSPHPLMTTIHEIAHHLAELLGAAAENEVFNAHKGTRRYRSIQDDLDPVVAKELNKPKEVFARAVAQLAVEKIGKIKDAEGHPLDLELQKEFKDMSGSKREKYKTWRPDDFARVREVLMKQLIDAGWTPRSIK